MSLRVNTNIEAFDAHRNLQSTQMQLSKSMQKLSSGLRINSAADDAISNEVAEHLKRFAGLAGRHTACCTPPRYRLSPAGPGGRKRAYLMVETSSPDIAPSCPDQVPQSCCGPSGKSKCPLCPPTER